jgi:cytosine deaminase
LEASDNEQEAQMKIAIAGGHGQIALLLTRRLEASGEEVVSIIRNPDHAADVRQAGGDPLVLDLEQADVDAITTALSGTEAIVFAAGAGPGSGNERKETVDYEAAAKLVEAGVRLDVKRWVMVSSMGADPDHPGEETFDIYLRAKGRADQALVESGLDYVIVKPGMLTNDQGTGRVRLGPSVPRGEIPREDVAEVLFGALRVTAPANHTFGVVAGDTPIPEAVGSL